MAGRLAKSQANALMAELIEIRNHVTRLIDDLAANAPTPGRQFRDYDMPTPDPDEIADRYGVPRDPDPDGAIPPWVAERIERITHPEEPS